MILGGAWDGLGDPRNYHNRCTTLLGRPRDAQSPSQTLQKPPRPPKEIPETLEVRILK